MIILMMDIDGDDVVLTVFTIVSFVLSATAVTSVRFDTSAIV